ncbi:MAG: hypothetical protein LBR07_00860 [Puniceicoccales bacterium]|jgi:hypothetical protein|nr:hypothetical protein [Puniceicoccales bacterium]
MRNILLSPAILLAAAAFLAPLHAAESDGIDAAKTEVVRARLAKFSQQDRLTVAKAAAEIALDASKPAATRIAAVRTLGLLQEKTSLPALKTLFADDAIADDARQAAQRIPGPETKSALLAGLAATNNAKLQAGFIDSLGALRATNAITVIKGYITKDAPVGEAAQRALAAIGTPDGFRALLTAPDSALKKDLLIDVAAAILECPGCAAGRPEVIKTLKVLSADTGDADVAFSALLLRYRHSDANAAEGLRSANPIERRAAAAFLNSSRDVESGKVLEKALATAEGADLNQVLGAIVNRHQVSAAPVIRQRAGSANAGDKAELIKALGQIGGAGDVAFFASLLGSDADEPARSALAQVRGKGVTKAFTDLITATGTEKKLRRDLLAIVQRRELRDAVPALLPLLASEDEDLRYDALKITERLGTKAQIPQIEAAAAKSSDAGVKNRIKNLVAKLSK